MGNIRKKKNQTSSPIQEDVMKKSNDGDQIVFTRVSDEELKMRRVNVYPYLM